MKYKVTNWDEYQYRKKDLKTGRRKLPWLMLHRSLLSSAKWIRLNDMQKAHFISLILCANDDGIIENDASLIKLQAHLRRAPDLLKFLELGLIEVYGTPTQNMGAQVAPAGQNREEKNKREEYMGAQVAPISLLKNSENWNSENPDVGWNLIQKWVRMKSPQDDRELPFDEKTKVALKNIGGMQAVRRSNDFQVVALERKFKSEFLQGATA